jgi:hypothetical protein
MKILYRLGFYLGGFSVGLIFLAFIFDGKNTSFDYSPSARVKKNLSQKRIRISDSIKKENPQLTDSLIRFYISEGSVDFSKSETKRDSCRLYHIELDSKTNAYLEVANCKETLRLIKIKTP